MATNEVALDTSLLNTAYSAQMEEEAINSIFSSPLIQSDYSVAQVVTANVTKKSIAMILNTLIRFSTDCQKKPINTEPLFMYMRIGLYKIHSLVKRVRIIIIGEGHSEDARGIGKKLLRILKEKDIEDVMLAISFWSKIKEYDSTIVKQVFSAAKVLL